MHKHFIYSAIPSSGFQTDTKNACIHINEVIKSNHKDCSDNYKHPKRTIAMLLNNMSQQDSVFLGLKTTTNNFMHNQQKALGISSVI